jgi:hypothetical protein
VNIDELRTAIRAGDVDRVSAAVVRASESERRSARKELTEESEQWRWDWNEKYAGRKQAATLAWAGTATARQIASESWSLTSDDRLYDVLAARGHRFMEDLVRMLLRSERPWGWQLIRRAVREGLVERPAEEGYLVGMIWSVTVGSRPPGKDDVYLGLLADPELLDEVWNLFEQDVGQELRNWGAEDNRWTLALVRLAGEEKLDRERLLDASLDALMRDFRESGVGWYAQMHEALEPTQEERAERLDRYLALLASPSATALKEGLTALKELGDAVPAEDLASAAPTALTQPHKTHAIAMLRLLETAARRDEDARTAALAAAAHALGHEHTDVQERALKLLERFPDQAPRAELLGYVDAVTPQLRQRVSALTGLATEPEAIEAPALAELSADATAMISEGRWPRPRLPNLEPGRPLEPVGSVDELIELASMLLEGGGTGDDAERFLDGVSRLCDERPPKFRERTEGLFKQAGPDFLMWNTFVSGAEMIAVVVRAWTRGKRPRAPATKRTVGGLLAARALEVADRAARGTARPLLSFPTSEGGWLDPERLAEREREKGRFFNRPDAADATAAQLSSLTTPAVLLTPERVIAAKRWAFSEDRTRIAFRVDSFPDELGKEVLEPLRQLGRPDVDWWHEDDVWPVADALGARWLSTLLPANPEVQFARALTAIADFVDGTSYRHPEVVLELMLDPQVPLRDPAWTAVAGALLAKSPDLQRVAADVVVTSVSDGRFDSEKLATGLAWLLEGGFGKLNRIEAPLRDAARVSPLHAAQVVRALEILVAALPEGHRNLHGPLGLANELAAGARTGLIEPATRGALERIAETASRSSKLGKSARVLLDLERDGGAYDAILRLAAAAASTAPQPARV